jgi:DNA-binding CsgD family transcriptional regulator
MTACDHRLGLIALEVQMGHLHQLAGDVSAAIERCERGLAMLGPSSGERWITSYLYLVFGFALFQSPDRSPECAVATRRALAATHDLGDVVGIAYALEVLGWLAARGERFDDAALLLGAADPLWQRTAGRLSNTALMEETHQRVVEQVKAALGDRRYQAAYAKGTGTSLDDVVRRAVGTSSGAARVATMAASASASAELTRREREIAALVASGLSNREIAAQLFISKRTVDAHVEHIFGKLDISSRVQLTVWLQSAGRAVGG